MRSIKLFGLTLLAVLAFGVVVAASASASEGTEAGLLFLKGEQGPVTMSGTTGTATLKSPGGSIVCTSSSFEGKSSATEELQHVTLFKDIDLHFSGCKEGKLACNTEGDLKEVILVLIDAHFVNLLESGKLRPGVAIIVLNGKLEPLPITIKCGVGLIEVRGAVFGLLIPLNKAKEITLVADVEVAKLEFPTSLPCDENDKLCKSIATEKPFEANFSGKFEAAEQKASAELKISPMVEVDD